MWNSTIEYEIFKMNQSLNGTYSSTDPPYHTERDYRGTVAFPNSNTEQGYRGTITTTTGAAYPSMGATTTIYDGGTDAWQHTR